MESFELVFISFQKKLLLLTFHSGNKVFDFLIAQVGLGMSGDFCHREGTGAIHLNGAAVSRAIAQKKKNGAGTGLRSRTAWIDAGPRPGDRESRVYLG